MNFFWSLTFSHPRVLYSDITVIYGWTVHPQTALVSPQQSNCEVVRDCNDLLKKNIAAVSMHQPKPWVYFHFFQKKKSVQIFGKKASTGSTFIEPK